MRRLYGWQHKSSGQKTILILFEAPGCIQYRHIFCWLGKVQPRSHGRRTPEICVYNKKSMSWEPIMSCHGIVATHTRNSLLFHYSPIMPTATRTSRNRPRMNPVIRARHVQRCWRTYCAGSLVASAGMLVGLTGLISEYHTAKSLFQNSNGPRDPACGDRFTQEGNKHVAIAEGFRAATWASLGLGVGIALSCGCYYLKHLQPGQ